MKMWRYLGSYMGYALDDLHAISLTQRVTVHFTITKYYDLND